MSPAPSVGDPIEPFVIESVSPEPMKTMAMLLRDPNPIHWDTQVTAELGLGDRPVNQGPINMSYAIEAAAQAAGGYEHVRRFRARFVGNVFGGDRLECTGTYTTIDEQAGTATIELLATAGGRDVLAAEAVIALSKSRSR